MSGKLLDVIIKRRSVRKFREQTVHEETILRILKAGILAPTAKNRQEWKAVIITDKELIKKFPQICNGQEFTGTASFIIALVSKENEYTMRCGINAGIVDSSLVMQNMVLQAIEEGLGSCYIGSFSQEKAKELLNVPEPMKIVQLIVVGYPAEEPEPRPRKELKEFYSFNSYE